MHFLLCQKHYVSVWFGQRADKIKVPLVCSDDLEEAMLGGTAAISTADATNSAVTYYIVFGSFEEPKDAKEVLKRYKKAGFENAGTIKSGEMTRVYLNKFNNLKEAMHAKQQLPYTYREAWVYKE